MSAPCSHQKAPPECAHVEGVASCPWCIVRRLGAENAQLKAQLAGAATSPYPYRSPRGEQLAWYTIPNQGVPVLTVELASKWYELFVVEVDGTVRGLDFGALSALVGLEGGPYIDHAPRPSYVRRLAEVNGWWLDDLAEELIEGRWVLESEP